MIMPQMFLMGEPLAKIFNELHPTLACGVPTIWNGLLHLDEEVDFSTMRAITAGGAAVPQSLIEAFEKRFGATIIQGWGMTETSPLAAFGLPPARRIDGHDDMYYKIKAGRVVAGVEVRVVAEDGSVLPSDGKAIGEFEIRGPWVTGSYYKDEDPTKFHDGWLCTGDVGTLDHQGYMTISDRTKDVIKSGGEWISSVELENAVAGAPGVFEAAVIAIPDPKWSERPLVCVVAKPGETLSADALLAYLVDRVPRWWLPDQWTFIDEIPKTSVGKYDKKVMRAAFAQGDYTVETVALPK
jgi:fatty-acyl-CoA synthase